MSIRKLRLEKEFVVGDKFKGLPVDDREKLGCYIKNLLDGGADEEAIRYIVTLLENQTELGLRDGLTGLYNRRKLNAVMEREQALVERHSRPSSIILLDVDYFKQVNDTYGHVVGDSVLKNIAQIMMKLERKEDFSCRYGGDEFVIVLPETNVSSACLTADRLRKNIESTVLNYKGRDLEKITISAGASNIYAGKSVDDVISCADTALYRAKSDGRNRVAGY